MRSTQGAAGTIYHVYRRLGMAGDFVYLGLVGKKRFVDETVPPGSATVTYQLQAKRSTTAGTAAQFNVNFGAGRRLVRPFEATRAA